MSESMASVIVVGAGPVGLDFGLKASLAGHSVTIIESGADVGAAIRSWGHVTLFSPWELNTSAVGRSALQGTGVALPAANGFPTGQELVEIYLEPLRDLMLDRVEFRFGTDVVAIGRGRILKNSHVGDGVREGMPFRVLIENDGGEELLEADVVVDASGILDGPNFLGTGGIPAIGEADADHLIIREIPDLETDRGAVVGRRVMVIGGGTSAATSLAGLLPIAEAGDTEVVWVTLSDGEPYTRVHQDPLPQRDSLAILGNQIAAGDTAITYRGGTSIRRLALRADDRVTVELENDAGERSLEVVDVIFSHVGYRPNVAIFEELQVHQCYASQAPMKLAAMLLAAGGGGDCLAQAAPGPDTLRTPEPAFFIIGAKSYGRDPSFLLRVGYEQADAVLGIIGAADA